jgi:mono/diheme cytochrome c family protein
MRVQYVLSILALTGCLGACSAKTSDPNKAAAASPAGSGERLYSGNCVPCHQQDGHGINGVYPSLSGSPVVLGDPGPLARWVIKGQRPADMPAGRYSTQMLRFGSMAPADAAALFTYLRSSFGNAAPAVDARTVAHALAD